MRGMQWNDETIMKSALEHDAFDGAEAEEKKKEKRG